MQQLDFSHLFELIQYIWNSIFEKMYDPVSLIDLKSKFDLIRKARNTDAHRKNELHELTEIIDSLYYLSTKYINIVFIN